MPWGADPVRKILSADDEARLVAAIRVAERKSSGEIRVHVESRAGGDPLEAARRWFRRLGMDRTAERNGILFYVAVSDHVFAVLGDEGIHAKVGEAGWNALRDALHERFKEGAFVEGLLGSIATAGDRLADHFPRREDDRNELPDSVSQP